MSKNWQIRSYGLETATPKLVPLAKLAYKDSLNCVMLQLIGDPSDFEKIPLEIKKSIDGGYNWDSLIYVSFPTTLAQYDIAYYNKNIIFLGADLRSYPDQPAGKTKLWISNDDGITWNYQEINYFENGNPLDNHKTKIIVMNDSTYLILYAFDLIKTTNYGKDWSRITDCIPWKDTRKYHRLIDIEKYNNDLYLLTIDSTSKIKSSKDFGTSWESNTNSASLPWHVNDLIVENSNRFLVIGGDYDNNLYSWHDTLFSTINAGLNWDTLDTSLYPSQYNGIYCGIHGFFVYRNPKTVYSVPNLNSRSRNIGGDKSSDEYAIEFKDAVFIGNTVILVDKYLGNVWSYTFPALFIDNNSNSVSLNIYPNPSPKSIPLNINIKNVELHSKIKFTIFDINGKVIDEFSPCDDCVESKLQYLPKKALSSGIYFLIVEQNGIIIAKEIFLID